MSLLTPLYIAGVLAVALPVIFHLLRRAPQKKQTFSSLMFLSPTPPRFTRRSRISNWLLLLLRAAVLTLLALAFARPFLPQQAAVASGGPAGRQIALLLDTSASIRRDELWSKAKQQADEVLNGVTASDEVSLYFFDRTVRPIFSTEQWNRLDPSQRQAAVRAEIAAAAPTWESTAIGDGVATVAEQLAAAADEKGRSAAGPRTVVLISDLQQGGRPEALQGRAWPESVRLDVRAVSPTSASNAGLQVVNSEPDAADAADRRPRVRVTNSSGSGAEQFTVTWATAAGPIAGATPQKVYAPPGRGQTIRVDPPPANAFADRLLLQGDAADFDNCLFVAPPRQETARVLFVGSDRFDDVKGLAFYVRTAFADTAERKVDLATNGGERLTAADLASAGAVIVGGRLSDFSASAMRQYAEAGGDVLLVLRSPADGASIERLVGQSFAVDESPADTFALVSRVDTTHPLLAAFADARFGDFSRVHFWKHRKVTVPPDAGVRTLASFDNGDPFLIEKQIGRGRIFVMTSGWQPADSQLAVSTKFVPIMEALIRPRGDALQETQFTVGDVIARPATSAIGAATHPWKILSGDGTEAATAGRLDRPGVFNVVTDRGESRIAVNLQPDESRTVPIAANDFKQWGVKLIGDDAPPTASEQRQAKQAETENQQKLWQWLILGVLGLVAAETAVAGRLARRGGSIEQTPSSERVTA